MEVKDKRFSIGIISDGSTDFDIIERIVNELLKPNLCDCIDLKIHLRDFIDKYWDAEKKNSSSSSDDLRSDILTLLITACGKLEKEITDLQIDEHPKTVISEKLIILSTDSERKLGNEDYFSSWVTNLNEIISQAIERFYDKKVTQNYSFEHIPFVIPLVFFPSTDVLIASARQRIKDFRKLKAIELKNKIYGVTDLRFLGKGGLEDKALKYLNHQNFSQIYTDVPEFRTFLHTLNFKRIKCF